MTKKDASGEYSIQIGEQQTQCFEAKLTPQWDLTATYSYILTAKIKESSTPLRCKFKY